MVLTPDMDCYAEDLNNNLGVRTATAGNQVPRSIPRGRAYRFDDDFPGDGEFEAYQEMAEDYQEAELERILKGRPQLRSGGRRPLDGPDGDDDDDDDDDEEGEGDEEEEEPPEGGGGRGEE